jgi:hypothetical protein
MFSSKENLFENKDNTINLINKNLDNINNKDDVKNFENSQDNLSKKNTSLVPLRDNRYALVLVEDEPIEVLL